MFDAHISQMNDANRFPYIRICVCPAPLFPFDSATCRVLSSSAQWVCVHAVLCINLIWRALTKRPLLSRHRDCLRWLCFTSFQHCDRKHEHWLARLARVSLPFLSRALTSSNIHIIYSYIVLSFRFPLDCHPIVFMLYFILKLFFVPYGGMQRP